MVTLLAWLCGRGKIRDRIHDAINSDRLVHLIERKLAPKPPLLP